MFTCVKDTEMLCSCHVEYALHLLCGHSPEAPPVCGQIMRNFGPSTCQVVSFGAFAKYSKMTFLKNATFSSRF